MKRFFEINVPRTECVNVLNRVGDYLVSVGNRVSILQHWERMLDQVYIIVAVDNLDQLMCLLVGLYGPRATFDNYDFVDKLWHSKIVDIFPSNHFNTLDTSLGFYQ